MTVKILHDAGSVPHDSSVTHVTGQSEFIDDRPVLANELLCGVVYSPYASATFKLPDSSTIQSTILKLPGVACVITAADVHHNTWGTIFKDQPIIAADEVNFAGEVVAIIGATSPETLAAATKTLASQIQWKKRPWISNIRTAIAKQSWIGASRTIARGNVDHVLKNPPQTLRGSIVIEGADHFYLESQVALVYPREQGQLEVHSSTQHPTETQHVVAEACGLAQGDVTVIVKRLGGGFGGKESQAAPIAAFAALVAQRTGKPARLVLTKDDDMIMTGKRNPFEIDYRVAFDLQGQILALDAQLYSDGGAYADLSTAIMERAMLHADNAYFIPNMRVTGQVCRTNYHPHTAFRGFGGPKGVALIESIIEDMGVVLKMDPLEIRQRNVYRPGFDTTHYGQTIENNCLPDLFASLAKRADYKSRRSILDQQTPDGDLRGLSMTAVKFGISFTTRHLNQGNALVILHRDGSLQVSTGAVEMGQGVNGRIATLVAEQFGVTPSRVRVTATATDKNANTSPTAASSGTDINGAAAVQASLKIKQRLSQILLQLATLAPDKWPSRCAVLATHPELTVSDEAPGGEVVFADGRARVVRAPGLKKPFEMALDALITEAYLSRVSLSEYGFHRIPDLSFNKVTGNGRAFLYFTQGVCLSQVVIDRWTGAVKVERVDLLMDLGRPINHGLDMGQVTGGFIQGMGWVTTEQLVYSPDGLLLTHSPSTYKIPNIQDTPRIFNVDLMENTGNNANIRGTKAAGEPPLLLALSVWTAIKDALRYGKRVANSPVSLAIPATAERIARARYPDRFRDLESISKGMHP